ncbi:MAG: hypothetical protein IKO86_04230 [Prevotella sp.]|nr:hypothetical protein [Prevotella sp.]
MKEEVEEKKELITTDATANAVQVIRAEILQSQQRALKAIGIYNSSVRTDDVVLISVNSPVATDEFARLSLYNLPSITEKSLGIL